MGEKTERARSPWVWDQRPIRGVVIPPSTPSHPTEHVRVTKMRVQHVGTDLLDMLSHGPVIGAVQERSRTVDLCQDRLHPAPS